MIVKGTKKQSKTWRWLQSAASKDETRPVLTGLHVTEGYVVGCDGHRLHAAKSDLTHEGEDLNGKIVAGKIPAGEFQADMADIEGRYPNIQTIMPMSAPTFEIWCNPKLLVDALRGMERPVCLRFFGESAPFEACDPEQERYALIMPISMREDKAVWRPTTPKTEMKARLVEKLAAAENELASTAGSRSSP